MLYWIFKGRVKVLMMYKKSMSILLLFLCTFPELLDNPCCRNNKALSLDHFFLWNYCRLTDMLNAQLKCVRCFLVYFPKTLIKDQKICSSIRPWIWRLFLMVVVDRFNFVGYVGKVRWQTIKERNMVHFICIYFLSLLISRLVMEKGMGSKKLKLYSG